MEQVQTKVTHFCVYVNVVLVINLKRAIVIVMPLFQMCGFQKTTQKKLKFFLHQNLPIQQSKWWFTQRQSRAKLILYIYEVVYH